MLQQGPYDFYSHAPRGARQRLLGDAIAQTDFYSHAPRGARQTVGYLKKRMVNDFYSHAPRGARLGCYIVLAEWKHFYSHAPRGARRLKDWGDAADKAFLLTRPSRGATRFKIQKLAPVPFLLTRPSRGATSSRILALKRCRISTHTPLAGRDRSYL